MTRELITLASDALTAAVNPLGAELWSLTDEEGRELMTDADPRWWTGRAPLLFPFVGRSRGDAYRLDGKSYPMPQHGFARHRPFALVERGISKASFRLQADAESRAIYPFEFVLDMAFVLEGATLRMSAAVTNNGETEMPFSFGFHPAFAWPLPFGAPPEAHRILFHQPEPAPIRRVGAEAGLIAAERVPSPVAGNLLIPTHAMFAEDAVIWDCLQSRSLLWGAAGTPHLRLEFPDTPWLGLWQKPGAHYLCIEPWAGMADPVGFVGDVWEKPGIMRLAPGGSRTFRMNVSLEKDTPGW